MSRYLGKPMRLVLSLILLLFAIDTSLSQKRPSPDNNVEVGMSYDQVRSLMGSPVSQDNGYTEVQKYTVVISARDRIISWMYSLFKKDTTYFIYQNTRKASYQRPVHNYSINDIPVTDDEYKSIIVDSAGLVTFRNPLTNDTTAIDSVIWKAYARSFRDGRQLREIVESGVPIIKKDSISYVPDTRDEPIPGSFRKLAQCVVQSMYAVLFDLTTGKVVEKGFYPYQIERLLPPEYYNE